MNLGSISDVVWSKLSKEAILQLSKNQSVNSSVHTLFYKHIYSKWSEGAVHYNQNQVDRLDAGWHELVIQWHAVKQEGKSIGGSLNDDSVGTARVQGFGNPGTARLWEKYNEKPSGDRFQFVVTQGGGMVLFNRMRRACQMYLKEKCGGDTNKFVVRGWKVFSEQQGMGRSDSCCVYTAVKYTDSRLATLVTEYVWPAVKDLVDANFIPLGFYKLCDKPLWAMPMPDRTTESMELGKTSKGSAGGLMGNIFAKAYADAVDKGVKKDPELTKQAKVEAQAIIKRLYGPARPRSGAIG